MPRFYVTTGAWARDYHHIYYTIDAPDLETAIRIAEGKVPDQTVDPDDDKMMDCGDYEEEAVVRVHDANNTVIYDKDPY